MADQVMSLADLISGEIEGELEIRLYQGVAEHSGIPQVSDFTEASYAAYEAKSIANPASGVQQGDGSYLLTVRNVTFSVGLGDINPGCLVLGAYVVMTMDGEESVVGFTEFDDPVEMATPGDYCQFDLNLSAKDSTLA